MNANESRHTPTPSYTQDTRRSFLRKGGLVAGGGGLLTLAGAERASAYSFDPEDFEGYYSVKREGAVPNDPAQAATNLSLIQACIERAAGSGDPPGTVYFPPGTWYVAGAALLVPSNVTLVGHGSLSVLKRTDTTTAPVLQNENTTTGNDDIRILDLTLDAARASATSGAAQAIMLRGGNRVLIQGIEARNAVSQLISLEDVDHSAVQGCRLRMTDSFGGSTVGIQITGDSQDIRVEGNITGDSSSGVGSAQILVTRLGTTGAAPSRVNISGNVCNAEKSNQGSAITVRAASQIAVVGNVCHGGAVAGIEISSSMGPAEDIDVADNVLLKSGMSSTAIATGNGILLRAPTAASAGDLRRINIRSNVIRAPRYHGIWLSTTGMATSTKQLSDVAVSGNLIWMDRTASYLDPAYRGVGIACIDPALLVTGVQITENEIRNALRAGIHVERRTSAPNPEPLRFDINDNAVFDSGESDTSPLSSGILVDGVRDVTVMGNRSQSSRDFGLTLLNPKGTVVVLGNTLTENTDGALSFVGAADTDRLRMRDNLGINPWTGEETLTSVGWSLTGPPYTQDVPVVLTGSNRVPFPSTKPPQLLATVRPQGTENLDGYAVAKNVTNTSFTLRVIATTKPTNNHKVSWVAEPLD